jgi:hypothetical protein
MDLSPHLDAIREDLEALVGADEALVAAMDRVARPLEASLQLRLLDVLGDGALELTEQLETGHAEVRVSGRDARLVYVGRPDPPAPPPPPEDERGTVRLTLRVPDGLKTAIEDAAETIGISVNAWLVQAAQTSLGTAGPARRRAGGNRISGYARS